MSLSIENALKVLLNQDYKSRQSYLEVITIVIKYALEKYTLKNTVNSQKIKWGRLLLQASSTGNSILNDIDLESLEERVSQLEERLLK